MFPFTADIHSLFIAQHLKLATAPALSPAFKDPPTIKGEEMNENDKISLTNWLNETYTLSPLSPPAGKYLVKKKC